ncbi:hypothetical protein U9M48_029816, partial [Paspalum notatum var. saurae]
MVDARIDPGRGFRLDVNCGSYTANLDYGPMEMAEQKHELWIDVSSGYNLDQFVDDMSALMIWGNSQALSVWSVDVDSDAKWHVRNNEHFEKMIQSRLNDRVAKLIVEVVTKEGYQFGYSSAGSKATSGPSGVTSQAAPVIAPDVVEGAGDTCSSPFDEEIPIVDWETLIILPEPDQDGEANVLFDEAAIFEAMGFKAAGDMADQERTRERDIQVIPIDIEEEMREASINVDDNVPEEPLMDWDRDNPDIAVGAIYPCMDDFRMAIRQHAIVNEFELGTEKSDKTRFRGFCKAAGCPWVIRARTQADNSVRVQINTIEHRCASKCRLLGSMASQAWVAERAIPLLKRKPNIGAKEIQEELEHKYNLKILYQTVWYGRQRAADKLFGKWDDSWDWLYRFKAEVELRSPGSVVEIDTITTEGQVRFNRFFCAFKGCIDGFLNGCRPYISIDSTALNGMWNGHMPAALALDGHNWMFPLAFGFFDGETKENWTWFMEQLVKAIGPMPKLAISSDGCKGLAAAVKKVFPWAEHRECFRHLMENMKKNYTGEVYGKNMWPAARAYTSGKYKYFMDKVLEVSPDVQAWLNTNHKLLWARSKFSTDIKVDYIHNNLAECWNGWIKELKDLPVHCMVDAIREKEVILFEKRRRISMALHGHILLAIVHQLNAASKGLGHLRVTKGHPDHAELEGMWYTSINMSARAREWQVTGKPCPHALAVITSARGHDMEQYVDNVYSVQKFRAAYAGLVPNITDRNQWPVVEKDFKLFPPHGKKRGLGRQRKNRIPSFLERSGKATRQVTCQGCGELGHRRRSWRCALTGTKKRKRKSRAKPGRKKKAAEASTSSQAAEASPRTPRTRAAAAREAAAAARQAASEANPAAKRTLALEVVPALEAPPATARPSLEDLDAATPSLEVAPKKMTPRKNKMQCTKK